MIIQRGLEAILRNNFASQQLHTATTLWFTREVKIPECCLPKTSAEITVVESNILFGHDNNNNHVSGGKNGVCGAEECMEIRGGTGP